MDFNTRDFFKAQRFFMKLNGMFSIELNISRFKIFFQNLLRLFNFLLTINMIVLFLLYAVASYNSIFFDTRKSLDDISDALYGLIIYGFSTFVIIYWKLRINDLNNLLIFINENYKTRSAIGLTFVRAKESLHWSSKQVMAWILIGNAGAVFMACIPILMGNRELPLRVWYPFDDKQPLLFELLYLAQIFGQIRICLCFVLSSGLFFSFVIFLCGQYDILFCSVKNFVATAALSANCRNMLRKLQFLQKNEHDEPHQYMYSIEFAEILTIKDEMPINVSDTKKTNKKFIQELNKAIKDCVIHHLFILDVAKRIENFYNPVCLVKTIIVTFQFCTLGFVLVKSTDKDTSTVQLISLLNYIILSALDLFIYTYYGEMLLRHSVRITDAVLRSHWYLCAVPVKKDLIIFMKNSIKPIVFTAGKIQIMNIERFRLALSTAFSYITLLQSLDESSS